MIEQQARVTRVSALGVRVCVGARTGCNACDAGRGCGAGLFGRLLRRRAVELDLPPAADVTEGQAVRIGISESQFLRLVMRLYGWPLLAGLAAGWLCHQIGETYGTNRGLGDLLTLFGLIAGAAAVLRLRRRLILSGGGPQVRLLGQVAGAGCEAAPAARRPGKQSSS